MEDLIWMPTDIQVTLRTCVKARLHRRFLSQQLNATQCNFCRAKVATSCDFIPISVQFVSVKVSTRLLLKQKLCAYKKVKILLKVTVFRELYLIPRDKLLKSHQNRRVVYMCDFEVATLTRQKLH